MSGGRPSTDQEVQELQAHSNPPGTKFALENLGSALKTKNQMSIPLLVLQWPATMEEPQPEEISTVEKGETWMTSLVRYLEADILSEEASRKVLYLP